MRFGLIAAAFVLAAAQPVLAQTVPDSPAQAPGQAPVGAQSQDPRERFQAYLQLNGYKNMLGQLAVMGDTISAPDCKEHKPVNRTLAVIFVPPTFGDGLHPLTGRWIERVTMSRCGAEAFQNVLIQAQVDNKPPAAALMMPGLTATTPTKQNQIMGEVLALLAKNKCTDQTQIVPVNTKRDKEIKPLKADEKGRVIEGAWKETWSFKACGKSVNASVELTADGKGDFTHKVKL